MNYRDMCRIILLPQMEEVELEWNNLPAEMKAVFCKAEVSSDNVQK